MKNPYLWTGFIVFFLVEVYSVLPHQGRFTHPEGSHKNYVKGAIHLHSTFSDGGGSPEEIAAAASEAGLDFVVLTDHNNDKARGAGFEKNYGTTDLFVEMEASTMVGHAVSFFSQSEVLKNSGPDSIVQATYRQFLKTSSVPGLFVAIAHPSNIKMPWSRLDDYAEGFEVVNFDSSWRRQLSDNPLNFLATLATYPFNQYLSALRFFETYPKDFVAWDEMTSRGPGHFAYLAHDTHSKVKLNNDKSLSWPGYLMTFKLASNILFLKGPKATNFEQRKAQYYSSLREGRLAFVYQALAPFEGNGWKVKCGESTWGAGDLVPSGSGCHAVVETPVTPFPKVVRLLKNGSLVQEVVVERQSQNPLQLPLNGAGTYRVEVWAQINSAMRLLLNRRVPWVFYNPIYLQS